MVLARGIVGSGPAAAKRALDAMTMKKTDIAAIIAQLSRCIVSKAVNRNSSRKCKETFNDE